MMKEFKPKLFSVMKNYSGSQLVKDIVAGIINTSSYFFLFQKPENYKNIEIHYQFANFTNENGSLTPSLCIPDTTMTLKRSYWSLLCL